MRLIRSRAVFSHRGCKQLLGCGRGCPGLRHSVFECKRPARPGVLIGGGFKCLLGKRAKLQEVALDKAVLLSFAVTSADQSTSRAVAVAMPPVIPGLSLVTFPQVKADDTLSDPRVLQMVSVAKEKFSAPFMGLAPKTWQIFFENDCTRSRFVFTLPRPQLRSGVVVKHHQSRYFPQLPPVHNVVNNRFVCAYCKCAYDTLELYLTTCVADAKKKNR